MKVDLATLLASRGKFARVCVEVDLNKPRMAGYQMRGEYYRLQYEGLQDLCLGCGKYGHRYNICQDKHTWEGGAIDGQSSCAAKEDLKENPPNTKEAEQGYGEWLMALRNRRRPGGQAKGKITTSSEGVDSGIHGGDRAESQQINANPSVAKRMATGTAHHSKSTPCAVDAVGPKESLGCLGGSRFVHLEVDNEGEEVDMEGIDVDIINGKGERLGEGSTETPSAELDKGKKPQLNGKDADEGVCLAASHESILDGVKAAVGLGSSASGGVRLASQRLKQKALKEATNCLEA